MKIAVINGPNLNLLGMREPEIYGKDTLVDINNLIKTTYPDVEFMFFQSNYEGAIVDYLQSLTTLNLDGLIINPAAYSHYSIAILDALLLLDTYKVEVHLSNPLERASFRHTFITASGCDEKVMGLKSGSYLKAVELIISNIEF